MEHSLTKYPNILNQTINTTFKYQISQQFIKLNYEKIKIPNASSNSLTNTEFITIKSTTKQILQHSSLLHLISTTKQTPVNIANGLSTETKT